MTRKIKPPRTLTSRPRARASADSWQEAQDLMERAAAAESLDDACDLLDQAIAIHPTHLDAHLMLIDLLQIDGADRVLALQELVAIGARDLGDAFFADTRGFFWLDVASRPYMRARASLADALLDVGDEDGAIREYQALLELNPHDNQGVRYLLLGLLLANSRLTEAGVLLDQFAEDASPGVVWMRVLERFLSGDATGAAAVVASAREQNRHMESFLAARRRITAPEEDGFRVGTVEEAQHYIGAMAEAWRRHPEAVIWLRGITG